MTVNILRIVATLLLATLTHSTFDVGASLQQVTTHRASPIAYASMLAQAGTVDVVASPEVASVVATARRLSARILAHEGVTVPLSQAVEAVQTRRALLQRSVQVSFAVSDGMAVEPWIVSPSAYPLWVKPLWDRGHFTFMLDQDRVRATVAELLPTLFPAPVTSTITTMADDEGVMRVAADHPAEPGYDVDVDVATQSVLQTFHGTATGMTLPVASVPGSIVNATGKDLGPLQHLATGRSDFHGSGGGRIANVRKGLAEYVHDVIVAPGESISFNAIVKNMSGGDWQDALVIMNGKDLVSFPGGGICQVATTVYRAALNTGLPIQERANHSLYVTYYEKYGLGIDATVFPRRQDLVFENNTNGYLLIQAYSKGMEAYVHFYGAPDGRSVAMEGPFLSGTESPDFTELFGRGLARNEIGWVRHVNAPDGTVSSDLVVSRYLSIPKRLHTEYASVPSNGMLADIGQ